MARKRGRSGGPNQSQFIRELFATNPNAKVADANEAWAKAGHKGTIGNSLFYVTKRKAGLTKARGGKRRGRPPGSKNKTPAAASPSVPTVRGSKGYAAVEDRLDEVIHMLMGMGDQEMVAELRVARRKIAAKLV